MYEFVEAAETRGAVSGNFMAARAQITGTFP